MPKSHLPPHAGPYAPAWTSEPRPARVAGTEPRSRAALEAEIERLRTELARLQNEDVEVEAVGHAGRTVPMLWCAVGLCGAALLFAIVAILYHG